LSRLRATRAGRRATVTRRGSAPRFAARTRVVVLRQEGDKKVRIPFNYNKVTAGATDEENLYLRPGDIVLVP